MQIAIDGIDYSLPDFLIIGAARSGTTSLFYSLRRHPRIFMPDLKEPFYLSFVDEIPDYSDLDFLRERQWTVADYAALFSDAEDDQLLGEASTSYLYLHEKSIENIQRVYGQAAAAIRFIANCLRSDWSFFTRGRTWANWASLNPRLSWMLLMTYASIRRKVSDLRTGVRPLGRCALE